MKQHVLFFDLDGTVADSGGGILGAMNEVLAARGAQQMTRADLTHIVGPPLATSYPKFFVPRGLPADGADEFIADYRAIYTPTYVPRTQPFDGILDVLDTLGRNWHLAIVTSKPEKQALMVLDVTSAASRFVHVVAAESDNEVPKARLLEQAVRELHDLHSISVEHDERGLLGDAEAKQILLRQIHPSFVPVDRHVLQEVNDLQCATDRITALHIRWLILFE